MSTIAQKLLKRLPLKFKNESFGAIKIFHKKNFSAEILPEMNQKRTQISRFHWMWPYEIVFTEPSGFSLLEKKNRKKPPRLWNYFYYTIRILSTVDNNHQAFLVRLIPKFPLLAMILRLRFMAYRSNSENDPLCYDSKTTNLFIKPDSKKWIIRLDKIDQSPSLNCCRLW